MVTDVQRLSDATAAFSNIAAVLATGVTILLSGAVEGEVLVPIVGFLRQKDIES